MVSAGEFRTVQYRFAGDPGRDETHVIVVVVVEADVVRQAGQAVHQHLHLARPEIELCQREICVKLLLKILTSPP